MHEKNEINVFFTNENSWEKKTISAQAKRSNIFGPNKASRYAHIIWKRHFFSLSREIVLISQ